MVNAGTLGRTGPTRFLTTVLKRLRRVWYGAVVLGVLAASAPASVAGAQQSLYEAIIQELFEDPRPRRGWLGPETTIRFQDHLLGEMQIALSYVADSTQRELQVWSIPKGTPGIEYQLDELLTKNPNLELKEALPSIVVNRASRLVLGTSRIARLIDAGPTAALHRILTKDDMLYTHGCRYHVRFKSFGTDVVVDVWGPPLSYPNRSEPFFRWVLDARAEAMRAMSGPAGNQ